MRRTRSQRTYGRVGRSEPVYVVAPATTRETTVTRDGTERTCSTCGESFPPGTSHGHGYGYHPDHPAYSRPW